MRIRNPELLEEFRYRPRCEWCGQPNRTGLDPHHLWTRGAGRLDIRINLIALCRACHQDVHSGVIARDDLLAKVSAREGFPPEEIAQEIYRLMRSPKK